MIPFAAMPDPDSPDDLVDHLERTFGLERNQARRVVIEVLGYFDESVEQRVVRRHRELQADGLSNPAIFARLEHEIASARFRAPALSLRQLRRMVYG